MATTLEEALASEGISSGYFIWKPNRLYTKNNGEYISTDVIADGTVNDVRAAVTEAGTSQIAEINRIGSAERTSLESLEVQYTRIKSNVVQTYTKMRKYFYSQGMQEVVTILDNAISSINQL